MSYSKKCWICPEGCPGDIALKQGGRVVQEREALRADGSRFPARIHAFPVYPTGQSPAYFIEVIEDITEDRLAKEEIEKLASIPKENPYPVLRIAADGTILYHNDSSELVLAVWQRRRGDRVEGKWHQMVMDAFDSEIVHETEIDCQGQIFSLVFAPVAGSNYVNVYGIDITHRKRADEELREKEKKYRDLVETMHEGLGVSDKDYVLTYVNRRFAEMLGYRQVEMTGRHVADFLDETNKQILQRQIAERRSGRAGPYDITWTARDGRKVYTLVSPKGTFDERGNFQSSFGVIMDISERKKVEDEREYLFKSLEAKNKELGSILHIVSHDLKSSLGNMEVLADSLKDDWELLYRAVQAKAAQMDEKPRYILDSVIPEAIDSIRSSAGRMDSLLSGVLRLSQVDSATLNIQRLNMDEMLRDIVDKMNEQVRRKNAIVQVEPLPSCLGDASQINTVFSNLLDNALEYLDDSRPGRIRVSGKTEAGWSIYCVEDNGIGIEPQYYEKIFDVFYQFGHEKEKGRGLGLTIVKRILDRHNGKIWVKSDLGRASRFYVSLSLCS